MGNHRCAGGALLSLKVSPPRARIGRKGRCRIELGQWGDARPTVANMKTAVNAALRVVLIAALLIAALAVVDAAQSGNLL